MKSLKIGVALLLVIAVTGVVFAAPIKIGTKNFTEQFVVGNLMAILLENRGYDVQLQTGMSSTVMREALETGALDLCMDYTGTQWLTYTGHAFKGESPQVMYAKASASDEVRGLVWLNPIWCNNTYAIAIKKEFAEENNVYTLTDFAGYVNEQEGKVPFASDFEFYSRPDKSVACMVFGTDSAVVKYGWVVLQDDKNFWPPYDLAPIVRAKTLDANPGLEDVLNELIAAFPNDPTEARAEMTALNAKVDIDLMEPEEAAEEWLQAKGLID